VLLAGCVQQLPVLFPYDAGPAVPSVEGGRFLSLGHRHTCDVRAGRLRCWGDGTANQLGLGDGRSKTTPTFVDDASDWVSVSTGDRHSCALKADGSVWCFGGNQAGQLGLGDLAPRSRPARVTLPLPARWLSTTFSHTCVVLIDASGWCWGSNAEGQVGLADRNPGADQPSPQPIFGGATWFQLEAGDGHTCGLQTDGSLWCWGRNDRRHLGLGPGSPIQVRPPTRVGTRSDWRSLSASQEGTCALAVDDTVWCQGGNFEDGTSSWDTPTQLSPDAWRDRKSVV
jgi:alpha-tubulin suppressor-like RCC1 family protein